MAISWIMPYGQLGWLRALNAGTARRAFDTPDSYVVGNSPFPSAAAPWACKVLPVFYSFEPYANAGAVQTGAKFPQVAYDPENWPATHPKVKRHPESALWHFAVLAAARGQQVIAAPSRDLIYAPGADRPWQAPESINQGYLRCQVPAAAEDAAALVCQNQGAEKDLEAYAQMLIGAAKQAPEGQLLYGGLTTNFATAAQMQAAYDAAMGCGVPVTGFWVTIASQAQAQVAADFFKAVL